MAEAPSPSLKVDWLELFYDLVYVTLVAAVTHLLHGEPPPGVMVAAFGLLAVVWTVWFNEVQATNLARGISARNRGFVLLSMAGVALMAVGVPGLTHGHYLTFVAGYGLARLAMAPVWIDQQQLTGVDARRTMLVGPAVAVAAALAARVGHLEWFWLALLALELVLHARRPGRRPSEEHALGGMHFDSGHLMERIGLFVMICFGESVAQLVQAMSAHQDPMRYLLAGLGLVLVGLLFWCFYDLALQRVEHALLEAPDRLREVLGFSQLAVVAGILGTAAGLAGAVEGGGEPLHASTVELLAGGVALVMLGLLSMSMDALRILITTALAREDAPRPPEPARRGGRSLLGVIHLAIALAGPAVVMGWGHALPPWLALVVLFIGPSALLLLGRIPAGSQGTPAPQHRPTPQP